MSEKVILINYTGKKGSGVLDAYEMTKALCDRGEKVVAVISEQISNLPQWKELALRKLVCIPTYDSMISLGKNTLLFPLRQKKWIRKSLGEFDIEFIYAPMDTLWGGMIASCFPRAKRVLVVHDPVTHTGGSKIEAALFARHIRRSDLIIVHTKKFIDYIKDTYHKPTAFVPLGRHNIYRSCEKKKTMLTYDSSKTNFLFFGRITPYKGLDMLAKAYRAVHDTMPNEVTLTVVGNGDFAPYEAEYKALPDTCLFVRWIGDEEVESVFLGENLVCVCPYKDATQSGVVLVALDYGVPCIVTKTGGLDEQVEDGQTGLVVPVGDVEALKNAMLRLASDGELRASMSKKAIEVTEEMTWGKSAEHLMNAVNRELN